jgi:hypothetical protein
MVAKLETTSTPGIFRRHTKDCHRQGRCPCAYVVVWRHRGRQHTESFRTLAEAREAKGNRAAGDRRPTARVGFDDYFGSWIDSYAGRTARGFSDRSREIYRRTLEDHALPRWRGWKLGQVEPQDVRALFLKLRDDGASTATLRGLRSSLSALFATAVEDGVVRSNPVAGVRIPPPCAGELEDARSRALTRVEVRG